MYGVKLTYVYFQINSNMIQIRPTMLNEQQIKRIKELSSTKLLPTDIAHQMNISLGTGGVRDHKKIASPGKTLVTTTILAIETSCDETAIAVVECSGGFEKPFFKIRSNIVSSQVALHTRFGGIVPNLAKREHIKNLPTVLERALKKAKIAEPEQELDALAVTTGPGLEPALWT